MSLLRLAARTNRLRAALITLCVAAAGTITGLAPGSASASAASGDLPPMPGTVPVAGAAITGEQWVTQRTVSLTIATPSFTTPAKVEVTLPTGYAAAPTRRWPVTYFLAGTNGDQTMFRTTADGESLTASYPSIVVSPSANPLEGVVNTGGTIPGGNSGYWSDWYNNGAGGPPMYETFVTKQLIPLIEANFRTVPDRAHRAVMGASMGGYGALMLTARHPDLFAATSSLSGAADSNWIPGAAVLSLSPALDLAAPDSIYGPRVTNEVRWRGHNPTDLAGNLGSVDVQLYTGNGVPGAVEVGDPAAWTACVLESGIVNPETYSLHNRLVSLGVPHTFTSYNWGCHTPAMFKQEITESLGRFTNRFSQDTSNPASFDYRSIEPEFGVFGWSVTADPNRASEFLDLRDVSADGFTVTGSGTTRVMTPPLFDGASAVTVMINGVPSIVVPDAEGRLTVLVDLGPADQDQQYSLGSVTDVRTSVVRFVG
ncbi:alpha/beta hydrolase family protein [Streptomyces sp. NPDC047042]|uniref:alpha/beta hydrolase n=1 Tax=Streptomyces sp. NPDC047042 TaxID=3154807 RepID=UPI0033C21DDE